MFKLSKYCICLPLKDTQGRHFLLNACNGDYRIVEYNVAQAILAAQKDLQALGTLDKDARRLLETVKILLPDTYDEEAHLSETCGKIHRDSCEKLSVTLIPGFSCNFSCPYCFERDMHKQPAAWYKERMSEPLIDAVFSALDKLQDARKQLSSFTLFGGEPFLPQNHDSIRHILDHCARYDVPISVVTNGYYLDDYLPLLKNYSIHALKITIDGTADIHDRRRAPVNGKSFHRIIRNVQTALENNFTVSLRTNINRDNFHCIPALQSFYEDSGLTRFDHFSYYFKATMACFEEESKIVSDTEIMEALGNRCSCYPLNSAYNRIYQPLRTMLRYKTPAYFKSAFCGAHSSNLVFDPLGNVSACWDILPDPRNVIGRVDIKNGCIVFNDNRTIWHKRTVDRIPHCRDCAYKLFCGGGCAAQGLVCRGDMTFAFCDSFIDRFNQIAIETVSELLAQNAVE